jgi:hypothetical protein
MELSCTQEVLILPLFSSSFHPLPINQSIRQNIVGWWAVCQLKIEIFFHLPKKDSKMLTTQDLIDQREQIQEDLSCVLDDVDEEYLNKCCDVIVNRFKVLIVLLQEKSLSPS